MAVPAWAVHQLQALLPLEERELEQILSYSASLPKEEASQHLQQLLGDTPAGAQFIAAFNERGAESDGTSRTQPAGSQGAALATPQQPYSANPSNTSAAPANHLRATSDFDQDIKTNGDSKTNGQAAPPPAAPPSYAPPAFAPPTGAPPSGSISRARTHSNVVIEAARIRARDEQEMQNALQRLQFQYGIYNSDIEPEHETDYPCSCAIHQYQYRKWARYAVQEQWSKAVMYPGEKAYNDSYNNPRAVGTLFSHNPYRFRVVSPYGYGQRSWYGFAKPIPSYHARAVHQTISLNNELNREAQQKIDAQEPKHSIWDDDPLAASLAKLAVGDHKAPIQPPASEKSHAGPSDEKRAGEKSGLSGDRRPSAVPSASEKKASKFASFRQSIGIKSSEERSVAKAHKAAQHGSSLRDQIEAEENGRWPDEQWRYVVAVYQDKVGMAKMIADLRAHKPIQYLHLLRAGYFEPIPVAWANQDSNPLKFSIEAAAGWRGITPAWRGYEDTAEERLYWVLNHREGSVGMRMKPDQISELNMANERMARAVEPPPMYFDPNDTCHLQHTSEGYSKQVMPAPFRPFDRPESANDDSIILLDVSGSMDFDPVRPVYDQYMITRYMRSTQPKNKDVAKAIIRRFTDALANHDHNSSGYDLVTFSDRAHVIGTINHRNLESMWRNVRLGGGTRVMTGWQKVKELHFQKHSESATYHPVYGWQAGPNTPMLRMLLLLDGEATDMDEFELDLLGLSWAHVTIFLIGVDGCPHHHRHANELQRISDVNHHVSFVDAQGNTPERYVSHELLKRHLGYDISYQEFQQMEELPPYTE